jgi:hypothetical protein
MVLQRAVVYLHGVASRMCNSLHKAHIDCENVMSLEVLGISFASVQEQARNLAQASVLVRAEAARARTGSSSEIPALPADVRAPNHPPGPPGPPPGPPGPPTTPTTPSK